MPQFQAHTLEELESQMQTIAARAEVLGSGLEPSLFTRRPQPESWSAAECVAHLNITADAYFPIWEPEIARAAGEQQTGSGRFRLDFWGKLLIWIMEPPPKIRVPAPPNFQPVAIGAPEDILPGFLERQRRISAILQSARGIALDRIRIASPFSARVRYSIWSSFCLTAAHERRHLWQAERALQAIGRGAAARGNA